MLLLRLATLSVLLTVCLSANIRTLWPDGRTYPSGISGLGGSADVSAEVSVEVSKQYTSSESEAEAIVTQNGNTQNGLVSILNNVAQSRSIGSFAFLSEDFLLTIPAETLASLRPEVIASLPPSVQARAATAAESRGKATAALLAGLGPQRFSALPWDVLITQIDASTLNRMGPGQITSIDWDAAMPNMPPSLMQGMSARALYYIPAGSWRYVSEDTFLQIPPRALGQMELSSLRQIPRAYYDKLPTEVLAAIPKDKLVAIDPQLLVAASGGVRGGASRGSGGDGARGSAGAEAEVGAEEDEANDEHGEGGSGCDDLTLGELTLKVSTGELNYPCRIRFRRLLRHRLGLAK